MEEKIQLIKSNLTGNIDKDINFLSSLYEEEKAILDDATTTIEAISIVLEEIKKVQGNKEEKETKVDEEVVEEDKKEKSPEEIEIDKKIAELLEHIDVESDEEALKSVEELIPKIEGLTKSEDGVLYCSFKTEFEKRMFEKIFAGEKKVVATPYANDTIYIIYADLLLKKKKRTQALEALERAIYWNFLNREAREKKLDIFFEKKEYVKYLDSLKLLQMISYTPADIASCYNKYGFIFNHLKDTKSAYAMYVLSYDYYQDENVANLIETFNQLDPSLKEMSSEEIYKLAEENDVAIGANTKIINAQRSLITELIENGFIKEAKTMLENDYAMTREEAIAGIYNQLIELENQKSEVEDTEEKVEEKPKKKKTTTTKKKTTTTKAKKTTN